MPNVNHPGLLKRVVAHCAFSAWVCFSLLMSVGLTSPSFAEDFAKGELEFRGRVILPPRTLGRRQFVQVTLVEVGSPFTARTYADAGGNFRFRKLNPASYTLSFYIPAFGEISQTLHLTESNVTAKNRFEKRFEDLPAYQFRRIIIRNGEKLTAYLQELFGESVTSPELIVGGARMIINAQALGFQDAKEMGDALYYKF